MALPLLLHLVSCSCCYTHSCLRVVPACLPAPAARISCPAAAPKLCLVLACLPASPPQLLIVSFYTSAALLPSLAPRVHFRWRTHLVVGMKLVAATLLSNFQRPAPMLAKLPRGNPVLAALHTMMGLQVGVGSQLRWWGGWGLRCTPPPSWANIRGCLAAALGCWAGGLPSQQQQQQQDPQPHAVYYPPQWMLLLLLLVMLMMFAPCRLSALL